MWHKGALTTTLLKWLEKLLQDLKVQKGTPLGKAYDGTVHLNRMFSFLFNSSFFWIGMRVCIAAISDGRGL
jgi:hypothetical protein